MRVDNMYKKRVAVAPKHTQKREQNNNYVASSNAFMLRLRFSFPYGPNFFGSNCLLKIFSSEKLNSLRCKGLNNCF